MASLLTQLADDTVGPGAVAERAADGGVGSDHPMRNVTRQVAFEAGWSSGRARKVAELFDSMADEWDASHSDPVRVAPVSDAIRRGSLELGGRWLELGAGTGAGTRLFAPAASSLVGLDLSLSMLKGAPVRVAPLVQGDSSALPFADHTFDGILMVNMLLFPAEVDRVLAPGGQIVWVNTSGDRTPIHLSPEDLLAALPGDWSATWAYSGTGFWAVASRA